MKRSALWLVLLGATTALAVVALVDRSGRPVTGRSSLAAGAGGWLAARHYLEARGGKAEILRQPLDRVSRRGVLVTVHPWLPPWHDALPGIRQHLRRGGTVVMGYSGESGSVSEHDVLGELGVETEPVGEKLPLSPLGWWRAASSELRLEPRLATGRASLTVRTPRTAPRPAADAEVLFADARQRVAVFEVSPVDGGRLALLPADALSNGRLRTNAALLDALIDRYGGHWIFDEYHHGLRRLHEPEHVELGLRLQAFIAQLLLVYLVGLWALARRFGPVWPPAQERVATTSGFLLGLGALHHRLRHHRAAARRLLAARAELDSRWAPSPALVARAEAVESGGDLVALAAAVASPRNGEREENANDE